MPPIIRCDFLKSVGAATASVAIPGALQAAAGGDSPNILFIFAEDMGYGDLSYLNENSQIPTPNIDRIAKLRASY